MHLTTLFPSRDTLESLEERLPLDKLSFDNLPSARSFTDHLPSARAVTEHLPSPREALAHLPGRRRTSRWERFTGREAPAWSVLLAAFTGLAAGICVGMLVSRGRTGAATSPTGNWNLDEIKSAWPEISDKDIDDARGDAARLAETIRSRTGEDAGAVRVILEGMAKRADHLS